MPGLCLGHFPDEADLVSQALLQLKLPRVRYDLPVLTGVPNDHLKYRNTWYSSERTFYPIYKFWL